MQTDRNKQATSIKGTWTKPLELTKNSLKEVTAGPSFLMEAIILVVKQNKKYPERGTTPRAICKAVEK